MLEGQRHSDSVAAFRAYGKRSVSLNLGAEIGALRGNLDLTDNI